jgi:hypothetical protein
MKIDASPMFYKFLPSFHPFRFFIQFSFFQHSNQLLGDPYQIEDLYLLSLKPHGRYDIRWMGEVISTPNPEGFTEKICATFLCLEPSIDLRIIQLSQQPSSLIFTPPNIQGIPRNLSHRKGFYVWLPRIIT